MCHVVRLYSVVGIVVISGVVFVVVWCVALVGVWVF